LDLCHSEETEEIRGAFDRLLAKECPTSKVRLAEPTGFDPGLWALMVEMGVPAMGIPVDLGGGGADLGTLAALAETAGRRLAPVPLVESFAASRAAARGGIDAKEIDGQLLTIALRPAENGVARLVPAGAVAERTLVWDGDSLVLVENGRSDPVLNLGCLPLADVALGEGSSVGLQRGSAAVDLYAQAVSEWRALTAASLVGLASEALALGVQYAKDRYQFGVPIGSFQAVAHHLADDATAIEGARLLTYEAAWAADVGLPTAHSLALMAFLFAAETAQRAAADSLHFHGGYGFMLEYDIQLYFRRAKAWALVAGETSAAYERLGTLLYGGGE
jgi:alkylation response protein AidB-like acyl-CoA dehydrogenase